MNEQNVTDMAENGNERSSVDAEFIDRLRCLVDKLEILCDKLLAATDSTPGYPASLAAIELLKILNANHLPDHPERCQRVADMVEDLIHFDAGIISDPPDQMQSARR